MHASDAPPPRQPRDLRTVDLDGRALTGEQWERVRGRACVRCGARGGLRSGGYVNVVMGGGTYGYPVQVCASCPAW